MPAPNKRDLEDLPQEVLDDLTFIFVENVREVFRIALRDKTAPVEKTNTKAVKAVIS
jgi:ATP-dependent Lon protease